MDTLSTISEPLYVDEAHLKLHFALFSKVDYYLSMYVFPQIQVNGRSSNCPVKFLISGGKRVYRKPCFCFIVSFFSGAIYLQYILLIVEDTTLILIYL